MTTEIVNPLDYPCQQCGVEPGEPCRFDCVAVAAARNAIEDSVRKERND